MPFSQCSRPIFSVLILIIIFSGCTSIDVSQILNNDLMTGIKDSQEIDSEEKNTDLEEVVSAEPQSTNKTYNTITLDDIRISLDVPSDWETWTKQQDGEIYYFIGTLAENFEFDDSQSPFFSEFYSDPGKMHGVHIQTIPGDMESMDLELRVNAPHYPVISETDLSDGTYIGKNVLMKDEWNGYYQFYSIAGKGRPGLKIETRSKVIWNEDGDQSFDDEKDKTEIDTIIKSIRLN